MPVQPLDFDVNGARAAGYSDADIVNTMAQKVGFDANAARSAGYGDAEIISKLTGISPAAQQAATPTASPSQHIDPQAAAQKSLANDTGAGEAMLVGAGRTFHKIGEGMQQLYYGATGNDKAAADLKSQVEYENALHQPLIDAHPIASAVGESLPALAIPVGGEAATALGAAGKMAVAGAAPGALEYGSVSDRAGAAAGGAVGGVLGGVVAPKVAAVAANAGTTALKGLVGNITPEALTLAAKAKSLGIPVNIAQLGDSKFLQTLNSSIQQMPFTGGAKAASEQRGAFTRAVSRTFGEDTDKVTPDIYASAKSRLGSQFDDLAARNNLNVDPALKIKLGAIQDQATNMADDGTIRAVNNVIDRIGEQSKTVPSISGQGATFLPGEAYSSVDSMLGNAIKNGGEKAAYLKNIQGVLRDGMDQSISPADQQAWQQTRSQYRNLKAIRDVVGKDAGDGNIPPALLMSALNNNNAGKEAMAMGVRGDLGDLGRIGRQFVQDKVPNSGTAQRAMAMGLVGGGGAAFGAGPATIAGMVLGGATAGRLLNKVMTSPQIVEALGKQGIAAADIAKIPPAKLVQILGATIGMTATKQLQEDQ